jgi:hypothetical protein
MLNRAKFFPYACLFILLVAFSAKKIHDRDIGFHLRAGEWILDHRSFPTTGVFSYGIPDHDHVNLYWLFEVTQAVLFKLGGYVALGIFQTLWIVGMFGWVRVALRARGLTDGTILWTMMAIVFVIEPRFNYRPEIWSWFFLTALIACFEHFLATRRSGGLWWIPAIMILWVNSHALFVLGYIVIGAYLWTLWRRRLLQHETIRPLALAAALALANPWFVEGALTPLQLLLHFEPASFFSNAVSELSSPWKRGVIEQLGVPFESVSLYYFFFIGGVAVLAWRFRQVEAHERILFAVFAYLSASQIRNVSLFALAIIPIVMYRLTAVPLWNKWKQQFTEPAAAAIFVLLSLGVTARVVTQAYYESDNRYVEFGYGLTIADETENTILPMIGDERVLNNPNCGNWLAWRLKRPVWITTYFEMMGVDIFRTYSRSTERGGLSRLIHEWRPDWIVFDHHSDLAWTVDLAADTTWHLAAYDARTACYTRKKVRVPFRDSISTDDVWKTLRLQRSNPLIRWLSGFYSPRSTGWRDLARGQFALAAGRYHDAETFLIRYVHATSADQPGVFKDLGLLYYFNGERQKAAYCLARYLDDIPTDNEAKNILQLVMRISHDISS